MPTFMDVFAAFSQTEYIKVGLKWDVAESKAAMAYATRLSSGHKPIKEATDDYHIEAFSKTEKAGGDPTDFTKMRFRQKGAYSGSLGYHLPDPLKPGVFMLYDNKLKGLATLKLGDINVEGKAEIKGDITFHGKLNGDVSITTKRDSQFAGTDLGSNDIGTLVKAQPAKGIGMYTMPQGGAYDPKSPRMYITDAGSVGVGLTKPTAGLHVKAANTAFRVDDGKVSFSDESVVEIDGTFKGAVTPGKRLVVLKNGNIGVNQPAPTEKFHVTGLAKVDSGDDDIKDKATVFITNTIATSTCDTHSLRVRDHFYVSTCGKVGVKVPSPLADFHVGGETKTDFLTVDKDATITGTFTTNKFAPLKEHFEADTVKVVKTTQLVGKVQMDSDVVIKGNLFVQKEVKMIGGGDTGGEEDEMSQMMESRIALLEESHKSLQKWHKNLLESHDQLTKDNHALRERVQQLEAQR